MCCRGDKDDSIGTLMSIPIIGAYQDIPVYYTLRCVHFFDALMSNVPKISYLKTFHSWVVCPEMLEKKA